MSVPRQVPLRAPAHEAEIRNPRASRDDTRPQALNLAHIYQRWLYEAPEIHAAASARCQEGLSSSLKVLPSPVRVARQRYSLRLAPQRVSIPAGPPEEARAALWGLTNAQQGASGTHRSGRCPPPTTSPDGVSSDGAPSGTPESLDFFALVEPFP